ncbi:MAG: DNA gyrase inhibitor YacG [Pyrinomonadaceae bacterium]|nr:DNA gyrase inhibitor YacG [Pyrinomonadaceae bacterium]
MKCPTCDKPVEWKDNPHRPFCSERCKLIDFGAWADGDYAVPSDEAPLQDELQGNNFPASDDRNLPPEI